MLIHHELDDPNTVQIFINISL